jgi:hypothetical protein
MTRKNKKPRFSRVTVVKEMAREQIGRPPASRVVPDRKRKKQSSEKHRPTLESLLEEP